MFTGFFTFFLRKRFESKDKELVSYVIGVTAGAAIMKCWKHYDGTTYVILVDKEIILAIYIIQFYTLNITYLSPSPHDDRPSIYGKFKLFPS